jgi:hypothetical protein
MIQQFDLADDGDKLLVYEGGDNSAPLITELSGTEVPEEIVVNANKLYIEFISNGSNTAPGFYLNYKTEQPDWCGGMTPLTEPAATISDGSGGFYYYNNSTCQWMIDPGTNEPLSFYFNYFDTEEGSDKLKFYDTETQELVAEISGSYETPPDPVIVPSGKAMIVFQTNSSVRAQGWELWYDIDFVGTSEESSNPGFSVIPNPVKSDFHIRFSLQKEEQVYISIYNLVGEEVEILADKNFTAGQHTVDSNLGTWPDGVYFIRLNAGQTTFTKKIIKTK